MKMREEFLLKLKKSQLYLAINGNDLYNAQRILNSVSKSLRNELTKSFNDKYLGMNPIIFSAVERKNINTIKFLLENGAKLEIFDEMGLTPVQTAMIYTRYNNNEEFDQMIRLLLGQDFNVNVIDPEERSGGETILHTASKVGYLLTALMLLNKGAKINAVDQCGDTPLHEAAYHNNVGLVEFFIINGADINIKNAANLTASDIAKKKGYIKIENDLCLTTIVEKLLSPNTAEEFLNINAHYQSDAIWFIEVLNYKLEKQYKLTTDLGSVQSLMKHIGYKLKNSDLSGDNKEIIINENKIIKHIYKSLDSFMKGELLPLQYLALFNVGQGIISGTIENTTQNYTNEDNFKLMVNNELSYRGNVVWDDKLIIVEDIKSDALSLIGE